MTATPPVELVVEVVPVFDRSLALRVVQQDAWTRGKGLLRKHGGWSLHSDGQPKLYCEECKVYVRGLAVKNDGNATLDTFSSPAERDAAILAIRALVDSYNASRRPKVPREWWVNVYPPDSRSHTYATKEEADCSAAANRAECVRVREVLE